MSDTKRYFDLKADTNRVEINLQQEDRVLVVTGPIAVDAGAAERIEALEASPGIKAVTKDEHDAATKTAAAKTDDAPSTKKKGASA